MRTLDARHSPAAHAVSVPSAARDLPAFYASLLKLRSLRVRQGCDRDQPVEHVTQILAGDEMVAPAVQLLPGRRSIGPLRWRGHLHSFAVHRAVQVSFLATPVLDFPLPALVRLVEHTTRIRYEEHARSGVRDRNARKGTRVDKS